jgi:hypothetical protein
MQNHQDMMRFPVLVSRGRKAQATFFTLRRRPRNAFVASDALALYLEERAQLLDFFMLCARRFFPNALSWQIDWPIVAQQRLSATLRLQNPCSISGDSWLLPLFLALACMEWSRPWPEHALVSGAIRRCRGLRCASVGGALHKLRLATTFNSLCFLPKSNVTQLRKRGTDVSACVAMPFNLSECLDIWRHYV